jgi:hypothetical protein
MSCRFSPLQICATLVHQNCFGSPNIVYGFQRNVLKWAVKSSEIF